VAGPGGDGPHPGRNAGGGGRKRRRPFCGRRHCGCCRSRGRPGAAGRDARRRDAAGAGGPGHPGRPAHRGSRGRWRRAGLRRFAAAGAVRTAGHDGGGGVRRGRPLAGRHRTDQAGRNRPGRNRPGRNRPGRNRPEPGWRAAGRGRAGGGRRGAWRAGRDGGLRPAPAAPVPFAAHRGSGPARPRPDRDVREGTRAVRPAAGKVPHRAGRTRPDGRRGRPDRCRDPGRGRRRGSVGSGWRDRLGGRTRRGGGEGAGQQRRGRRGRDRAPAARRDRDHRGAPAAAHHHAAVVLAGRGRLGGRMLRRARPRGTRRRVCDWGQGALALAQRVSRTGRRRSWRPRRRGGACGLRLPCGFASAVRPRRRRPPR